MTDALGQIHTVDGGEAGEPTRGTIPPTPLKELVIRGSIWTMTGYGASQVLRLGNNLVLAWLLFPEAFGLMALVKVFMQGLGMFSDIGINPSIVQNQRGDDPDFLNTAWTIQVGRGVLLWVCTCLLAWPFAAFYGEQQLAWLIPVAGLAALIGGFMSTSLATARRHLEIGRLTRLEVVAQIVSILVMVLGAWLWHSVWAIVIGGLVGGSVKLLLSHTWLADRPNRFRWDREAARSLFGFGKWIFASTLLTFLALNLDRIMLGKFMTLRELGLYSMAIVLAMVAVVVADRLSTTVIYPALAKKRDDPLGMVAMCIRARYIVLWAAGATCSSIAIVGPLFFERLYDPRYAQCGQIVQWLTIYIWARILVSTVNSVPLAIGQPRRLFVANLIRTLGYSLAVVGYVLAGLPGFIVSLVLSNLVAHAYIVSTFPAKRAAIRLQTLRFTAGFGLFTAAALAGVNQLATAPSNILIVATLAAAAVPGCAAALAILAFFRRSGFVKLPGIVSA